jgi:hypothetical protein
LNSKTLLRWLKDENKIESSRKGSKRAKFNRTPKYPEMEDRLYREYKDLRKRGLKVKAWWFKTKAPQIRGSLVSKNAIELVLEDQLTIAKRSQ